MDTYQIGTENSAQERGTKMAQFQSHQEAENFRSDVSERFPQLTTHPSLDIHSEETGKYERSFFSVYLMDGTDILFHTYIGSEAEWNGTLLFSRYIARTIEDNQQSEEVERGRSFVDQNGVRVIDGQTYTVEEYEAIAESQELHGKWYGNFDPADYVDTLPEF